MNNCPEKEWYPLKHKRTISSELLTFYISLALKSEAIFLAVFKTHHIGNTYVYINGYVPWTKTFAITNIYLPPEK